MRCQQPNVFILLLITKYFGNVKHKCLLPGLLVCCKYACVMRAFDGIFCVYCAIHDGPVTSTCISHCQSFPDCLIGLTFL